jgi:hypothetical protein
MGIDVLLGACLEARHFGGLGIGTLYLALRPRRLLLRGRIYAVPYLDAQPLGFVPRLGQRDVLHRAEAGHLRLAVDPVAKQPASRALVLDLEMQIGRDPVHDISMMAERGSPS